MARPVGDTWTRLEKVFLPINAIVAGILIYSVFEPTETVAATEIVEIVNEAGDKETYEVPLDGFHQDVLAMFWRSSDDDPERAWLDYGLPAVLAQDLSRSPLLSVETPFDSASLREKLKQYGSDDGRITAKALSLQIAREGLYEYLLTGDWETIDDGSSKLSARLFRVATGELVAEFSRQGSNSMELIDQISSDIRQEMSRAGGGESTLVTDLTLAEHFSESVEAIKLWVEARVARGFANDYERGIELLGKAVELDPTFAAANGQLGLYHRLSARNEAGIQAIDRALRHDYKLSTRDRFVLRANRYAMLADIPKAVRVLEMWVEIEPQSVTALSLLGNNYLLLDGHLDQASAAFAAVRRLDPEAVETYLAQAQVEQQRRDFSAAEDYVNRYLEERPEDFRGLLLQAAMREQTGDLDGARESYENASILQDHEIDAELGLLGLDLKQGRFEQLDRRVESLLDRQLTVRQSVAVRAQRMNKLAFQGRLAEALELATELSALAESFMVPIVRIMNVGSRRATYHTERGELEIAMQLMDEMATQIQPPMDGFINFVRLGVLELTDQRQQFRDTMVKVKAFRSEVDMSLVDPLIMRYEALITSWDGDIEAALEQHQQAILLTENSVLARQEPEMMLDMLVQKANYLKQLGRMEQAQEILESVLALNPTKSSARLELAALLLDSHKVDAARVHLSELSELWAQADPEYVNLARLNTLLGQAASD